MAPVSDTIPLNVGSSAAVRGRSVIMPPRLDPLDDGPLRGARRQSTIPSVTPMARRAMGEMPCGSPARCPWPPGRVTLSLARGRLLGSLLRRLAQSSASIILRGFSACVDHVPGREGASCWTRQRDGWSSRPWWQTARAWQVQHIGHAVFPAQVLTRAGVRGAEVLRGNRTQARKGTGRLCQRHPTGDCRGCTPHRAGTEIPDSSRYSGVARLPDVSW